MAKCSTFVRVINRLLFFGSDIYMFPKIYFQSEISTACHIQCDILNIAKGQLIIWVFEQVTVIILGFEKIA